MESSSISVGGTNVPCAQPSGSGKLHDLAALLAHRRDVRIDAAPGVGVDHRADVRRQPVRIAHRKLLHRAGQHLERAVRDVVLQTQNAQRGTALTGAIERRLQ